MVHPNLSVLVDTGVFYSQSPFPFIRGNISRTPHNLRQSLALLDSYRDYLVHLEELVAHPATYLIPPVAEETGHMATNLRRIALAYGGTVVKPRVEAISDSLARMLGNAREVPKPAFGAVFYRHPRTIETFAGRKYGEIIGNCSPDAHPKRIPIIAQKRYGKAEAAVLADALVLSARGPVVAFTTDRDLEEMFKLLLTIRKSHNLLSPVNRVQIITGHPKYDSWEQRHAELAERYSFDSRTRRAPLTAPAPSQQSSDIPYELQQFDALPE